MTYEEAMKDLDTSLEITITDENFVNNFKKIKGVEALELAYRALEKQIPKKPVNGDCPICGNPVQFWSCGDVKSDYCDSCGQALNWEQN